MYGHYTSVPFGVTYEKIGTIQRRLAWPLHKDDTLSRSGRSTDLNIYFPFCFIYSQGRPRTTCSNSSNNSEPRLVGLLLQESVLFLCRGLANLDILQKQCWTSSNNGVRLALVLREMVVH
ncbi:hypothetical protein BDP27DRAFT_1230482 [Rhodocollybia butyracea]|uniref:Uncharacterized protein n=1 Tax=Rhodocollybia butyracea TaxID=206335 RepID=A0A9P5PF09_9AGAR|nr:hypothetical protein BDP27DRAFT_1230482 [Rhodocollybia butyracea]